MSHPSPPVALVPRKIRRSGRTIAAGLAGLLLVGATTGSLVPAHLGASRGCLARSAQQRDPLVGRRGDVVRRVVEQLPREVRQGS